MSKYPHEFLGRCGTCLDNAYLSGPPCSVGFGGNGTPLFDSDCAIRRARAEHDRKARALASPHTKDAT